MILAVFEVFLGYYEEKIQIFSQKTPCHFLAGPFASFLPTYAKGSRDSARRRCRFDDLLSSGILSRRSSFDSTKKWHGFGGFLAFFGHKNPKNLEK
jgi:hypothetical protein